MNAIDFIKMSLEMSKGWIYGLAEDMKDSPTTSPTPNGGNHPLWCVGHLVYSEGNLICKYVQGGENPVAEWEKIFAQGTEASEDASIYPSYEEVLEKFAQVRSRTMAILDTLTDADLEKSSHAPEEIKEFFGTVGQCLAATIIHFGFHGGQIADARRAAGKPPLMG